MTQYVIEFWDVRNSSVSLASRGFFGAPNHDEARVKAFALAKGVKLGKTVRLKVKPVNDVVPILDKEIYLPS
jgi:hypothetical protein